MVRVITWFVLSITFMVLLPLFVAASQIEEGVIDEVRGEVVVIDLGGRARAAVAGGYVLSSETIRTGPGGFVRVIMTDGSVLAIHERSRVEVDDSRTNPRGSNSVVLFIGRVWGSITGSADGRTSFAITTPTAVAGVRGTEFTAAVGLDGATRVGVDKGLVSVSSDLGSVDISAGKETTVDWEAAPEAAADYAGGDEQWREWGRDRQDKIVRHGKRIVPLIVKDVKKSRREMGRLKKKGERMFTRFKKRAERQQKRGVEVELTPRQKREIFVYLKDVVVSVKELHASDCKMMARYRVLLQIKEDCENNPDQYTPEFADTVTKAVAELHEIDVEKVHRENREIIVGYVDGLDRFAQKHQLGKYKDGAAPDREKMLIEAREAFQEKQPR